MSVLLQLADDDQSMVCSLADRDSDFEAPVSKKPITICNREMVKFPPPKPTVTSDEDDDSLPSYKR